MSLPVFVFLSSTLSFFSFKNESFNIFFAIPRLVGWRMAPPPLTQRLQLDRYRTVRPWLPARHLLKPRDDRMWLLHQTCRIEKRSLWCKTDQIRDPLHQNQYSKTQYSKTQYRLPVYCCGSAALVTPGGRGLVLR